MFDNPVPAEADVKVLALHYRMVSNIGDRSCCPIDYFNFFSEVCDQVILCDFRLFRYAPQDVDVVVWGGGALGTMPEAVRSLFPSATYIGWGIGCTSRELLPVSRESHVSASQGFDLWGGRDYGAVDTYVPCVSCMSPLFDRQYEVEHQAVVFGHASVSPLEKEAKLLNLPYLDNATPATLEEAIAFLAKGETVVTSSYHGAYWATLLGKKVAMIPFGRKFYSLKHRPVIAGDVASGVEKAESLADCLAESREANNAFAEEVKALLLLMKASL